MLEVIGAGNPDYKGPNWADTWANSPEYKARAEEINEMTTSRRNASSGKEHTDDREFAMPLWTQIIAVSRRSFIAYWRTPNYAIVSCILWTIDCNTLSDTR